jgi:hypothetical protein
MSLVGLDCWLERCDTFWRGDFWAVVLNEVSHVRVLACLAQSAILPSMRLE